MNEASSDSNLRKLFDKIKLKQRLANVLFNRVKLKQAMGFLEVRLLIEHNVNKLVDLAPSTLLTQIVCHLSSTKFEFVSWGKFTVKNASLYLHIFSWQFFVVVVFVEKMCFYQFHLFFDELLNFCNRILKNQEMEQMISNCQWNCMMYIRNNL